MLTAALVHALQERSKYMFSAATHSPKLPCLICELYGSLLGLQQDRIILQEFHRLITLIWREGEVLQHWKYAIISALHKKNDKTKCGKYRGIPLVSQAGKMPLKLVARKLGDYCEAKGWLPEEQHGF